MRVAIDNNDIDNIDECKSLGDRAPARRHCTAYDYARLHDHSDENDIEDIEELDRAARGASAPARF